MNTLQILRMCFDFVLNGYGNKQAIKRLEKHCTDIQEDVTEVASAVVQLLPGRRPNIRRQLSNALCAIIRSNGEQAFAGICKEMREGDFLIREACFNFIVTKLAPNMVTKNVEIFIANELAKLLSVVEAMEFYIYIWLLSSTPFGLRITEHFELLNLTLIRAELIGKEVINSLTTDENVNLVVQSAREVMLYFSKLIDTTSFVIFICDWVLPLNNWSRIGTDMPKDKLQLSLLKFLAEICPSCRLLENAAERIGNVYKMLLNLLPLPQLDAEDVVSPIALAAFNFPQIECLLYALRSLAKNQPNALTFMANEETIRDFRKRLQYLKCGTQLAIKQINAGVEVKTIESVSQQKLKQAVTNINLLIRDLFHAPFMFRQDVTLSWHESTPIPSNTFTDVPQKLKANKKNRFKSSQNQKPAGRIDAKLSVKTKRGHNTAKKLRQHGNV